MPKGNKKPTTHVSSWLAFLSFPLFIYWQKRCLACFLTVYTQFFFLITKIYYLIFIIDNAHNVYYHLNMKDKEVLSLLQKDGWKIVRINGSHYILEKNNQTVSLPVHGKDMKKGLEIAILKKAGLR